MLALSYQVAFSLSSLGPGRYKLCIAIHFAITMQLMTFLGRRDTTDTKQL